MFRVVLKNVGENMVNKDFNVPVDTLDGAMVVAYREVIATFGYSDLGFQKVGEWTFAVMHNGGLVGSFTITKLN